MKRTKIIKKGSEKENKNEKHEKLIGIERRERRRSINIDCGRLKQG